MRFDDWLVGYACSAHAIQRVLARKGWARAKGNMKRAIIASLTFPPDSDFCRGMIDAYLDSVGC